MRGIPQRKIPIPSIFGTEGAFARWFPRASGGRDVAILAGGTILGQGIAVAASPLLTRLYSPEAFGVLAVFTSILGPLVVASSLSYQKAIPLAADDDESANLLTLSMLVAAGFSALVALAVVPMGSTLASWLNSPGLSSYLWVLPISLLTAACNESLVSWAIRVEAFTQIAKTKIRQGVGQVVTTIVFGVVQASPLGLLVGDAVGRSSGTGSLLLEVRRHDPGLMARIRRDRIRSSARRFRHFPVFSTGSSLLNSLGTALPPLLMAAVFGPAPAGLLALGQRVIVLPASTIGRSVAQVYLGRGASLVRTQGPGALVQLYVRSARKLFLIGFVPMLVLALAGPPLFAFVFGATWREAGVYVRILALAYLMNFVATPLSQTLIIVERLRAQFYWDVVRPILIAAPFAAAHFLGWGARTTVTALAAAILIAYVVHPIMCIKILREMAREQGS